MSTDDRVDLVVTGMTCASCAQRIERKLNKVDGVNASVNYATGIAHIKYIPAISIDKLVDVVDAAGYHAIAPNPFLDEQVAFIEQQHEADLLRRWVIGLIFALPTVLIAMIPALQFSSWQWVTVALATPVVTWSAWPLHRASYRNARHATTTMDTLVSIGIIAAYVGSIFQLISMGTHHNPHIYIDVAVVVPVFVVLGRWLESRNKRQAGAALRALSDATPKTATVITDDVRRVVALSEVVAGDIVLISAESTIAVDGIVMQGTSSVSNALLTGESMPIAVTRDSEIYAGAINHDGELLVRATGVGSGSQISRIASLVAAAQSGKANISRLADRISAIFVPAVLSLTAVVAFAWYFIDSTKMVDVAIAVLVIACPCALGLATPTALVVGSGRAATLGILIAGPEVFENSRSVDVVVFDKTGTLTTGEMKVTINSIADPLHIEILASLVRGSSHPISVATSQSLEQIQGVTLEGLSLIPGKGVRATYKNQTVEFGSRNLHPGLNLESSSTTSWLFVDGQSVGAITVDDTLDSSAVAAVAQLQINGAHVVLASGDIQSVANKIGREVGIIDVRGELTPAEKIDVIKEFQALGKTVAMVGDGSNDAPALAQADIAVAMGRGTGIARATADITLLRADLMLIPIALKLASQTLKTIKINLGWAFGYNLAALPLAMSGNLNPMIAGIAMSASSVLVVSNSLRLRTKKLI
jgi:Cu+-exporting ATPase